MKRFIFLALLLLCAGLLACSPPTDTVRGQVFVVTEGRQNLKLGLVSVELLPEEATQEHIKLRENAYRKAVALVRGRNEQTRDSVRAAYELALKNAKEQATRLQPELSRAEAELAGARRRALAADGAAEAAAKAYREEIGDPATSRVSIEAIFKASERYRLPAKRAAAESARAEVQGRMRDLEVLRARIRASVATVPESLPTPPLTSAFYFDGLPPARTSALTAADGNFTLNGPRRGRFVLAAHTQRRLLGMVEEYFWLVRLPEESRTGTLVLLSNNTLTTAGSPLSLIRTDQ